MSSIISIWVITVMGASSAQPYLAAALQGDAIPFAALPPATLIDLCAALQVEYLKASSETSFRHMADTVPLMIWMTDAQNNTVYFSKHWLAFTGRTFDEEAGAGWTASIHPEQRETVVHTCLSHFHAHTSFQMEFRMRHYDGSYCWLLDVGVPRYEESGAFAGFIGFCVDISDRKAAEERTQVLQELTFALAQALTLEQIANTVIIKALPALQAHIGIICLLTPDGQNLKIYNRDTLSTSLFERYQMTPLAFRAPLNDAVRENRPLWFSQIADHFDEYPHLAEINPRTGTQSIACLPLMIDDRLLGGVSFSFKQVNTFSPPDRALMLTLAQYCALALERARLYESERTARIEAETAQTRLKFMAQISTALNENLDFDVTLQKVARLLIPDMADWCGVFIVLPDNALHRLLLQHRDETIQAQMEQWEGLYLQDYRTLPGIAGMLENGDPLLYTDVPDHILRLLAPSRSAFEQLREFNISSVALLPLNLYGHVLGILICGMQGERRYDPQADLPLLQEVARRTATSIDKASLYREMQAQRERLRVTLASIADAVIATDMLGNVIFMNRTAQALTGWQEEAVVGKNVREIIRLYDPDGEDLPDNPLDKTINEGYRVKLTNHLLQRADEEREIVVDYSGAPIRDENSTVLGSIFVLHDMTERHRLENAEQERLVLEERQRLAREMHDAVTQTLFASSIIAEALPRLAKVNPDKIWDQMERLRRLNRGALAEMRTLLLELRHVDLLAIEIADLLEQLTEALTAHVDLEVVLDVQTPYPLRPEVQTTLYRIAQEGLNNIVKHARASRVEIRLHTAESGFTFSIKDNGVGFLPEKIGDKHLGLRIMRERVDAIKADLQIISTPGSGTEIAITKTNG